MLASKALVKIPDCLNLFIDGHPFPCLPGRATLSYSSVAMAMRKRKMKNASILVRAGYTKRPWDTPGAYELIDEDSGEKVIVWGGAGDEKSPIPPRHVISWDPRQVLNGPVQGKGLETSAQKGGSQNTITRKLSRTFGRLKVDKVRKFVSKASQGKQEIDESEGEEQLGEEITASGDWYDDQYLSSDSEDEFMDRKEQRTVKEDIDQLHQHQIKSKKSFEPDRDSSKTLFSDYSLE